MKHTAFALLAALVTLSIVESSAATTDTMPEIIRGVIEYNSGVEWQVATSDVANVAAMIEIRGKGKYDIGMLGQNVGASNLLYNPDDLIVLFRVNGEFVAGSAMTAKQWSKKQKTRRYGCRWPQGWPTR